MDQPVLVTPPHYITREGTSNTDRTKIASQYSPSSTLWKKGMIKLPYDTDLDDVKNQTEIL
jgi:hypothetical protein